MYVLLKDVDNELDKGFYLQVPYYNSYIERTLIELYYRGIAEGLVDYSVESLGQTDIEVKSFCGWIDEKLKEFNLGKSSEILKELNNVVVENSN